jgi:lipopolysaccharide biosynthesis glycosyltransferase
LPFFVCIISSRAQKAPLLVLTSFIDLRFYILAVILKSEWFSKVSLLILLVICS